MKKQIKIVRIIVIIIVLTISMIFIFRSMASGKNRYLTDYYEVHPPSYWHFEPAPGNDTVVNIKVNGEQIGYIAVFPEFEYGDSLNSIITNIYGMHAYLKEEFAASGKNSDLLYCVAVGYEPSAIQETNHEFLKDELHYLYMSNKNTLIDFCVENLFADDKIRDVMESIKVID